MAADDAVCATAAAGHARIRRLFAPTPLPSSPSVQAGGRGRLVDGFAPFHRRSDPTPARALYPLHFSWSSAASPLGPDELTEEERPQAKLSNNGLNPVIAGRKDRQLCLQ